MSFCVVFQRELEKEREIEQEVYRSDAASMRRLVETEVAHIRYMAGLDPTKVKKDSDNESEVIEDIEGERLHLKDVSCPLAPVLPDKYLTSTPEQTDWDKVDSKLDK